MEARVISSSTIPIAGFSTTTKILISSAKLPKFSHNKISPRKITSHGLSLAVTCLSYAVSNISNRKWMVLMESPSKELTSKPQIIDYYVSTLEKVLGSKEDAQMCIYDASGHPQVGFCCDIEEEIAHELAGIPGVVSVKPDLNFDSLQKDPKLELNPHSEQFCSGTMKPWIVRMGRPAVGVIRKASVVNYFVQVLMRILGNETDAQMCMYHVSWESIYGFCCILDNECAQELSGMPGVMSILPDEKFSSDDKDYVGQNPQLSTASEDSTLTSDIKPKTKKLFITGLSFYTSEKTLRAAFEGFGELTEVKIIMDKISKRSKGYAFVEYTTYDAASTALREMNGKLMSLRRIHQSLIGAKQYLTPDEFYGICDFLRETKERTFYQLNIGIGELRISSLRVT